MGVININSEDYVLLKGVKQLSREEYDSRIALYDELSIEDKIDIHKKCLKNIVHYLSRIGMKVEEIGYLMNKGVKAHEKFISNENVSNFLKN